MIKFFRNIRRSLLNENKMGKPTSTKATVGRYFKYAIGEILLVVIGILIALQINNWNEERLQNKIERKFMVGLNTEFQSNSTYLDNSRKESTLAIEAGIQLMSLMGAEQDVIKKVNIDSLLFYTFEYGSLDVSENSIEEILQAGQLQNFKNDSIKTLILEWTQVKKRAQNSRLALRRKSDILVEYLIKNYPLKDVDNYGVLGWKSKSKIQNNKYAIFNDLEFENTIDDLLFNIVNYKNSKSELQEIVQKLIEETSL